MRYRTLAIVGLVTGLSACATGPLVLPVQATRFHYAGVPERGTVSVEPGDAQMRDSPEFQTYAAAVTRELERVGFTRAAPGARAQNMVTLDVRRTMQALPPRRSPVQIGLGGGGFSGGRGGGTGLGGGLSFPLGGGGAREGVATEMQVRIRRGANAVWEGQARSLTEARSPAADAGAIAARLAGAMFQGFPGESGRTIEVR